MAQVDGEQRSSTQVQRMNNLEYLMWLLEADPLLTSQFANLTMLDSVPDIDRLRARLDRAAQIVPRLHQWVEEAPARIAAPCWRPDADFHIDHHFRVTELPAEYRRPGGLERFACALDQEPLHRDRPLWEFVLITGLDGDRAAMVQRMDHTVTDGEGGLRMSMAFIDLERDAPDPPPVDRATGSSGGGFHLATCWRPLGIRPESDGTGRCPASARWSITFDTPRAWSKQGPRSSMWPGRWPARPEASTGASARCGPNARRTDRWPPPSSPFNG